MKELEDLATELKGKFDLSEKAVKAVEAKIEEIKASIETTFEEKKGLIEKAFNDQIEELKGKIQVGEDRANQLDELLQSKSKKAKEVEKKSFGELMQDGIKDIGGGDFTKGLVEVEKMLKSQQGTFVLPISVKAVADMTTAGSLTGDPMRTYNTRQGILPFQKINMRDYIPTVNSETGTYVTYRETGSEGSISTQTEGSAKSQIDYDFTEVVSTGAYVAGYATFTKQFVKNLPFMNSTLPRLLMRDFWKSENSIFFTAISSTATGVATVDSTTSDIEAVIELVANQQTANFNPSFAFVSPKQLARMRKETFTNGYYAGAGTAVLTEYGMVIAGMPILPAPWVTDHYILIIDNDYVERVEMESMNLVFSYENADNFIKNKVTARIECQEVINTLRVDSNIYKNLAAIS